MTSDELTLSGAFPHANDGCELEYKTLRGPSGPERCNCQSASSTLPFTVRSCVLRAFAAMLCPLFVRCCCCTASVEDFLLVAVPPMGKGEGAHAGSKSIWAHLAGERYMPKLLLSGIPTL